MAPVSFPLRGEEEVVSAVLSAVTSRTRLAMLDHVTSPTALVFPIGRLVAELSGRGVDTLVDGAHALGMVPLDLTRLGAAYYTANAHKWLCAPKSAAFLHVRRDRQKGLHPVSISHGYAGGEARFRDEFDWTGTTDPTPALCIPECIRYLGGLAARRLAGADGDEPGVGASRPEDFPGETRGDSGVSFRDGGSMAAAFLPTPSKESPLFGLDRDGPGDWMRARGVESWFHPSPSDGAMLVRLSAQLYNTEEEYVRLAGLLAEALREG